MRISTAFALAILLALAASASAAARLKSSNTLNDDSSIKFSECVTSRGKTPGKPCIFPFIFRNKTYSACTYDISHIIAEQLPDKVLTAWCSTKVDRRGRHVAGQWGTCEAKDCPVPPQRCGETTQRALPLPGTPLSIVEVPWMTSLGVFQDGVWHHQCGGSLVTNFHVLTAAHCFQYEQEGYKMRLGNANLNASFDFEVERNVAKMLTHPKYKTGQSYFDVGLAVADAKIEFTSYVLPVCLPFRPVDDQDDLANTFVNLAGWGVKRGGNTAASSLTVDNLRVNPKELCEKTFSRQNLEINRHLGVSPLSLKQQLPFGFTPDTVCAGSEITRDQTACHGDSGSPLFRLVSNTVREPYYEQVFVVQGGVSCDLGATIYIKIANRHVLTWIQKETGTSPMLMVVGGYNELAPNGLLNDVEIVSTAKYNLCTKRVRPLPGKSFNFGTHIEREAATLGLTGQVANDQAVVCGGKNLNDNQNRCYAYNLNENKWNVMESMSQKRYYAASALDEFDNLWVLGGSNGSDAADSTEIYDFSRRKWKKGRPLPPELRDSGINSHCVISLNKTHVVMAGGYANDFTFVHPNLEDIRIFVGGRPLKQAWMFDGRYWDSVEPMSTIRDRPACSVVQMPDGRLRVLVAGGCQDWCVKHPAVATAEMFDPDTNTWSAVADLPRPLSSAKMELLDGLPTVVGGFDNEVQNDVLYQYHVENDTWVPHPTLRLRVPRSSAAVFQVPWNMFPDC